MAKWWGEGRGELALVTVAIWLLVVPCVWADGFSGQVGGGVLAIEQADNLSGRGNATIGSLHEKPGSSSIIFPIGVLEMRYAWDGKQVSLGTPLDEPAGITVGYRQKLAQGGVAGSVQYSFWGKEWRNPYLVGVARSDTLVHTMSGRLAWEGVAGSPLTLAIKAAGKIIATEELTGDLRRDGVQVDLDVSWRQRLSEEWAIIPTLGYQRGEYVGGVNSFHGGTVGLGVQWRHGDVMLVSRFAGTLIEYDREHPLFNDRRRDYGYRASGLVTWNKPFGWQQVFIGSGGAVGGSDATIDFFDRRTMFVYTTLGYQF